jgi:hypothetical protein
MDEWLSPSSPTDSAEKLAKDFHSLIRRQNLSPKCKVRMITASGLLVYGYN